MNLNKAMLIGRLTKAPELRQTPSGQSVCSFGIATNRAWTDQGGKKQEKVEFHNIVVWGRLAEICNQYLAKGQLVFLEGRIESRSWNDKTHPEIKHYRTEIIAEAMQMGPRGGNTGEREDASNVPPKNNSKINEVTETIQYPGDEDIKPDDIQF
ncbi:MAG: single-stranded DNA-binding protein [Patescibacteria group bacterium]